MLAGRPWSRKSCDVKGYTDPALYRPPLNLKHGEFIGCKFLTQKCFSKGQRGRNWFSRLFSLMSEKWGVILTTAPASTWSWLPLWDSGTQASPCMEIQSLSKQFTHLPPAPSGSQQPRPSLQLHAPHLQPHTLQSIPGGPRRAVALVLRGSACSIKALVLF